MEGKIVLVTNLKERINLEVSKSCKSLCSGDHGMNQEGKNLRLSPPLLGTPRFWAYFRPVLNALFSRNFILRFRPSSRPRAAKCCAKIQEKDWDLESFLSKFQHKQNPLFRSMGGIRRKLYWEKILLYVLLIAILLIITYTSKPLE